MNVSSYIIEKSETLFGSSSRRPTEIDIRRKRFTSVIDFCKITFDDKSKKEILIKSYDDGHPSRLNSLQSEYDFARNNRDIFNSEEIGLPNYILFHPDNGLVVIEYLQNCITLEKTLLQTHSIYRSIDLSNLFYNAGMWLAKLHSVNSKLDGYNLKEENLLSEFKTKWINSFNDLELIQRDIKILIDSVLFENTVSNLSILHKEFAPGNILHVEDKVYGIDFGTLESGCVLDDIAYFVISVMVLNKYPKYPLYSRMKFNSNEIDSFKIGYCSNSDLQIDIFKTTLFQFFLYKNLLRRISSQLKQVGQHSRSIGMVSKTIINQIFARLRKKILSNSNNLVIY